MKYIYLTIIIFSMAPRAIGQIVNIPDPAFKSYLLNNTVVDINNDYEIQLSEAEVVETMYVGSANITDLTGLEAFTNLQHLVIYYNPLTSINLTQNVALEDLEIAGTQLTSLDISNNTALDSLMVVANQITTMDVSNNHQLRYFYYGNNPTTSINFGNNNLLYFVEIFTLPELLTLDFAGNPSLKEVTIANTGLTNVNLENSTQLEQLSIYGNNLAELDVSNSLLLNELNIMYNNLTSVNVSNNPQLTFLNVSNNNLVNLDVRNGANNLITVFNSQANPNLTCIMVDDSNASYLATWFKDENSTFFTSEEECESLTMESRAMPSAIIFPNPSQSHLFIRATDTITNALIYNGAGQLINVIQFPPQSLEPSIDIRHLKAGIYIVKIKSASGEFVEKVVKL